MIQTTQTSKLYQEWPNRVEQDLKNIQQTILDKDFASFGKIVEENARFMHATMRDATPSISYDTAATLDVISKIHHLRKEGLDLFFTQDAGPNIKLIYLAKHSNKIKELFPPLIEV